jgi:hypothetical protein
MQHFLSSGQGRKLHDDLLEHASTNANWLERWWDDAAYLLSRFPCMVNTNYAAQLWGCCDRFPIADNQIAGAASATLAFLSWYVISDVKQTVEPELFRKKPMSMFQHGRVFGVAQLPGEEVDVLQWTERSKHIVVQAHNSW